VAVAFVAAAVLLVLRRHSWWIVAVAATAASLTVVGLPLLAGSSQGVAGVVTNGIIAAGLVVARRRPGVLAS
jgi:hypothetical protein